jgi:lycopene cyclase domain-containing protein
MFWEYSLYMLAVVFGTFLLNIIFRLKPIRNLRRVLSSIIPVTAVFIIWDIFAVYRDHWSFNAEHTLGLIFINLPLEEIVFFFAVPFYYITIWELTKKLFGGKK